MRSFFSPFVNTQSHIFNEDDPFSLSLSVHAQRNDKIFLITITAENVIQKMNLNKFKYVKFSSALRDDKPSLVIEGTDKVADAKVIVQSKFVCLRAKNCSFLPIENHKKINTPAYLTTLHSTDDNIVVIPFPSAYRPIQYHNVHSYVIKDDQPTISDWPFSSGK